MDFKEYQERAKETAVYPEQHKIYYPALGLSAEIGELNNKIKKRMRDGAVLDKADLAKEIGDVLWYISALCTDLDISLHDAAVQNIEKLKSRKERGVLQGSGDNR